MAQHKALPVEDLLKKSRQELFDLYERYNLNIAQNPNDAESYFTRSHLKYYFHDTVNAIVDIQKAIKLAPTNSIYHYVYAYEIIDLGQFKTVIQECDSAIKYDKNYLDAFGLKGLALSELGQMPEARIQFAKALSIDSTYKLTYTQLFSNYVGSNDLVEAEKILDLLLSKYPDYEEGLSFKARLYLNQKKYDKAIVYADKLLKLKKNIAEAHFLKSAIYDSLKNQKDACQCMLSALLTGYIEGYDYIMKKCPKEQEDKLIKKATFEFNALELEKQLNYPEAIKLFNEAIKLSPDSGINYYNRGKMKRKMNDHIGAIEDYQIAVSKSPHFSDSYIALGVSYSIIDKLDSAKKYYLKCMKIDPFNEKAYYNYADILKGTDNYKEAVYYYNYAIDIKPDYTKAFYGLGECYAKLGMNAEACQSFKAAEKFGDVKAISQRLWYCK